MEVVGCEHLIPVLPHRGCEEVAERDRPGSASQGCGRLGLGHGPARPAGQRSQRLRDDRNTAHVGAGGDDDGGARAGQFGHHCAQWPGQLGPARQQHVRDVVAADNDHRCVRSGILRLGKLGREVTGARAATGHRMQPDRPGNRTRKCGGDQGTGGLHGMADADPGSKRVTQEDQDQRLAAALAVHAVRGLLRQARGMDLRPRPHCLRAQQRITRSYAATCQLSAGNRPDSADTQQRPAALQGTPRLVG
jgi:hypothetical protein